MKNIIREIFAIKFSNKVFKKRNFDCTRTWFELSHNHLTLFGHKQGKSARLIKVTKLMSLR